MPFFTINALCSRIISSPCNEHNPHSQCKHPISIGNTTTKTSSPTTSQNSNQPQVGQVFTFNGKSLSPNDPQKCADLARVIKGKAVPDYNLCDVVVYRQVPPIVRHDNLVMNNYSGLGHYIEFVPASVLNHTSMFAGNSSSNNNQPLKAAFGDSD